MKLKWKVIVVVNIIFILFVSFKILQPDIIEQENEERGDNQMYTSSPKLKERRQLLKVLEDKFLLNTEYCKAEQNPWKIAAGWVKDREVIPEEAPELGCVLHSLKSAKILAADTGIKGTQLKLSLVLEGGQIVAFKPKWYARDYIQKTIVSGWDRHNGEIAVFHLGRLLDLRRTPIAVGRRINLKTDIIPVASQKLLKTFVMKDGNQCLYGKCYFCKPDEPVCADGDILEGVVILWLPERYKIGRVPSPWIRSYKQNVHKRWEIEDIYCDKIITTQPYDKGPRMMDVVDAAILDYLSGNADRHHFELLGKSPGSMVLILDNGKSFGDPNHDEASILAPLRQCCRIRETTWHSLLILQDKVLSSILRKMLDQDSIAPVLDEKYYTALDRRLLHILNVVQGCIATKGQDHVLITNKTEIY